MDKIMVSLLAHSDPGKLGQQCRFNSGKTVYAVLAPALAGVLGVAPGVLQVL
jgi:hypothetical protein